MGCVEVTYGISAQEALGKRSSIVEPRSQGINLPVCSARVSMAPICMNNFKVQKYHGGKPHVVGRVCRNRFHSLPSFRGLHSCLLPRICSQPRLEFGISTSSYQSSAKELKICCALPADSDVVLVDNVDLFRGDGQSRKQVLRGMNLSIPRGTLHMIVGPNGCGKSTLLRMLAGMLPPTSGHFHVDGTASLVFQNPDHQVVLPTVGADVAFGLGKQGLSAVEMKKRAEEALEMVQLGGFFQRPVYTLSGGQKQRVAIAGALATRSQVLLLDELTTFLDSSDQRGVVEAVRRAVTCSGVTALWVTHRLEELEFADGATYLDKGRMMHTGSAASTLKYVKQLQADYHSKR